MTKLSVKLRDSKGYVKRKEPPSDEKFVIGVQQITYFTAGYDY